MKRNINWRWQTGNGLASHLRIIEGAMARQYDVVITEEPTGKGNDANGKPLTRKLYSVGGDKRSAQKKQ